MSAAACGRAFNLSVVVTLTALIVGFVVDSWRGPAFILALFAAVTGLIASVGQGICETYERRGREE